MDEKNTVRAVAFDYKAVLRAPGLAHAGIPDLLAWLAERDVAFVLLTTDPMEADAAMSAAGLPAPALHLSLDDIPDKKKRGSGVWLQEVAQRLKLRMNQLLLVGTTKWDWLTGINAGVVYIHANWASQVRDAKSMNTLSATDPEGVAEFLEHFFLPEPAWTFAHDSTDRDFQIRSLLPPNVRFPRAANQTFELQDVFTRGRTITIGNHDARDILMLRLLSSAYLDGTLPGRSLFCVYPSSNVGKVSAQLAGFLEKAKVMVGSYYKDDLLERVITAPDTSIERVKRNRGEATTADITIAAQTRTVRINPKHQGNLTGKTVVVFDDFTTEGTSIEWARTLLLSAGAAQVIVLTVGKYGSRHTSYELHPGTAIDPFDVNDLTAADFVKTTRAAGAGQGPADSLTAAMNHFIAAAEHQATAEQAPDPVPANAREARLRPPAGRRTAMTDYKTARQRHLADMLTHIQQQQVYPLVWRGEYLIPAGKTTTTALWWIALPGQVEHWYHTSEAEDLVSTICQVVGIIWEPVPPPGGATQLAETLARMEKRRCA
ncbi:phosphoribosyltransferase [Streptomyces sp. NPDC047072]|uniref:phosphoribosyltransferase n=1 Tax=Streptomyces sp. NPDC047072 TaxID=3154809 RepID=UPI0033D714D5